MLSLVNKFIFFALIGYFLEIICISYHQKKYTNNHFLFTFFCPMYGIGGLLISIFIKNINNYLLIFILSLVIATIVEYTTSYLMETIFKVRWWDYKSKKINFQGRISLITSIEFGILGVIIKIIDNYLNYSFKYGYIVLIIILIDLIISTIYTYKITNNKSYKRNILTDKINKKVNNLKTFY